ncbi:MAG: hypothetical protein JWP58_963 [Hymenobacter sp.]|nr:hypothetical protein [Hymenobacter sp.]
MKNKRLLYVLLPAVLAIWGLIFQRIWSAAAGEPEPEPADAALPHVLTGPVTAHTLPKLLLNYSDPFKVTTEKAGRSLDQPANRPVAFAQAVTSPTLNFPVAPVPVAVAPVVWPSLRYLGFINNPRQNSRIALLAINEQEVMLKSGDNRQGVVVASIFRDSVQVTFQGKKKTVSRLVSSSP